MRTLDDEIIDMVTRHQALEIELCLAARRAAAADKLFVQGGLESPSTSLISSPMPVSNPAPANPFETGIRTIATKSAELINPYPNGRWS